MTWGGGKPHAVGDRGQRYEVRFKDAIDLERIFGWSDTLGGAQAMFDSIKAHPTWNTPTIIDREATK